MTHHFAEIDGDPSSPGDGAVNLGLAVDVDKKGRLAHADGARLRDAGNQPFDAFLRAYDDSSNGPHEQPDRRRSRGANITLTNPGGIGTSASVPRLMEGQGTIVATGAIAYPPGLAAVGAQSARTR